MKRTNSPADALNRNKIVVNVGDGLPNIELPLDGNFGGGQGEKGEGVPEGGAPLQVVRKTAAGTTTEWVTLTPGTVGLSNVDNTADKEKPLSTPQAQALATKADLLDGKVPAGQLSLTAVTPANGARPVGQGELVINAGDYGAVPSTSVDQSPALNAAEAAAFNAGPHAKLLVPRGNYRIDATVIFRCSLDATEATFTYYGSGTAVVLGSDQAGVVTARQSFRAPRVVKAGRTNGWDGTSVGIQANNLNTCTVHVPFVQDFEQGLVVWGNNGGNAYTTYDLGALWENHKNLVVGCTVGGYSNQNLFLNGRLQQSVTKGATLDDMNASQIYMVSQNAEGGPNNNTFINTSIEGLNVAYYRVQIAGSYNQFINVRWEAPGGVNPRIRYLASALRNKIVGGYMATKIEEIFEGTNGGGSIDDTQGAYLTASSTAGQLIPHNTWTPINSWGTPVANRSQIIPETGEFKPRPGRWQINATVTFAPNATGRRVARLAQGNSIFEIAEAPGAAGSTQRVTLRLTGTRYFNGQDTLKVECMQTSGADLALESSTPYVSFRAEYLGY